MNRYPFIAIEGLDGTGKTTLRKGLFRLFQGLAGTTPLPVLTTNYLVPEFAGDLIRGKYHPDETNRDTYLRALGADKKATTTRLVLPSLPHRPVIVDRWLLSEMAFFSVKHGQAPGTTYAALADACPLSPDLTLILDIEPEAALRRTAVREGDSTRADWDSLDVQTRIRRIYQDTATKADLYPQLGPITVINADTDRADILHQAWTALDEHGLTNKIGAC
ncbi:dTMP kinase [Streptomyces lydicus]|uniref:dTMP kinase n=1 Tax=Streptomyces lydicus TaxID=47763 RepID=UPI00378EAFF4